MRRRTAFLLVGQRMSIVETDLPDAAASLCPLITGAAGNNMALFKEMRKPRVLTAFDMDGATFKTEDETLARNGKANGWFDGEQQTAQGH
jgi:hypothetical protein